MKSDNYPLFSDERFKEYEGYWTNTYTELNRVVNSFNQAVLERIAEEICPGARILDLGCSDGTTTEELCRIFPDSEITGIDIDARQIQLAKLRQNRRALYEVQDGFNSDYRDNSFDLVVCMNNLALAHARKHIDLEKLTKILPGIARLPKTGRFLAFSDDYSAGGDSIILTKNSDRFSTRYYKPGTRGSCEEIARILSRPLSEVAAGGAL